MAKFRLYMSTDLSPESMFAPDGSFDLRCESVTFQIMSLIFSDHELKDFS